MEPDVVSLTQTLVRTNTADANEDAALALVAPLLEQAGFQLTAVPWRTGRSNLLARWGDGGPLVLSGHLDTVPFGTAEWHHDPLGAEIGDGRLYGRGSSDMKGGVAALVCAAIGATTTSRGFFVALSAGEETGCEGAAMLREAGLLPHEAIFVIGEATGNEVLLGHKGASWMTLTATGQSAHGSRPDLGVNAVETLADAMMSLRTIGGGTHPQLGSRTTNVGTITGGVQTNLVPDHAELSLDVRTVPGAGSEDIREALAAHGRVESILDLAPVWSDPESPLTQRVVDAVAAVTGVRTAPTAASYFTDAAVLDASAARSYIIGPGDPDQPHTTDESLSLALLAQSQEIYREIIAALT